MGNLTLRGMKPCNRAGCYNVMCGRFSEAFGYLCDTCFNELTTIGVDTDVQAFMDSTERRGGKESYTHFDVIFHYTDATHVQLTYTLR